MSDSNRDPDDIQADIARTRGRLDETLSAIERRLEPSRLMDQGVDYLRNHGAKTYFVNLGETAKQQQLPLALVGLGLAWLMLSDRGRNRAGASYALDGPSTTRRLKSGLDDVATSVKDTASDLKNSLIDAKNSITGKAHDARDSVAGSADDARSSLADARDRAAHTAADVRDKVSQTARNTAQTLSDTASAAREQADRAATAARHGAERVKDGWDNLVQDQPLVIGAIGLAVGAVLAASAPRTRQEDRLMGSASDHLKDEAKAVGREQLDQAKEVAAAATNAATDAAAKKGDSQAASSSASTVPAKPMGTSPGASPSPSTTSGTSTIARTGATTTPGSSPAVGSSSSPSPGTSVTPGTSAGRSNDSSTPSTRTDAGTPAVKPGSGPTLSSHSLGGSPTADPKTSAVRPNLPAGAPSLPDDLLSSGSRPASPSGSSPGISPADPSKKS